MSNSQSVVIIVVKALALLPYIVFPSSHAYVKSVILRSSPSGNRYPQRESSEQPIVANTEDGLLQTLGSAHILGGIVVNDKSTKAVIRYTLNAASAKASNKCTRRRTR
jgi:hypothetical protein